MVIIKRKYLFVIISVVIFCLGYFFFKNKPKIDNFILYIGGYGDYFYKYSFNSKTLEFTLISEFKCKNASFLTLNSKEDIIFALSENGKYSKQYSFANISPYNQISEVKNSGIDPCYITYYKEHILSANYGDGTISIFSVDSAGCLGKRVKKIDFLNLNSSSLYLKRSRLHTIKRVKGRATSNEYLLATDLGLDRIYFLKVLQDSLFNISLCDTSFIELPKDSGPRHIDFSKDGRFMYLLNEKSGKLMVFSIVESNNNLLLTKLQDTIADRYNSHASADIHVSPNGKFLYTSHRKNNDGISIFRITDNGLVEKRGYQVTDSYPRNFAISPDGNFMFVACQKDKKIQLFRINEKNGFLTNTKKTLNFINLEPSCIIVK